MLCKGSGSDDENKIRTWRVITFAHDYFFASSAFSRVEVYVGSIVTMPTHRSRIVRE
jgi:hypothetical protein